MKVLVVDDDRDQLFLRSMLLEHSGFQIVQASNGRTAIEQARRTSPACAVMDLCIPTEAAGLQLIRDLRNWDATMRLIVLTGSDPSRLRNRPEGLLVDELLVKPASTGELIERLRSIHSAGNA